MKIFLAYLLLFLLHFLPVSSKGQCCNCSSMGPELIRNGNFESGNTGFTSAYAFSATAMPGMYGITTDPNLANPLFWKTCTDHTSGTGKFMWLDLSNNSSLNVWSQNVSNIQPNTAYLFSCWVSTLDARAPAILQFSINGSPAGPPFTAPPSTCSWVKYCFLWRSGNSTTATLSIVNQSLSSVGNDVGIDDISFQECIVPIPLVQNMEATICKNDSFRLSNGRFISTPGLYYDTVHASVSCDTIRNIKLKVTTIDTGTVSLLLCKKGLPYFWNNHSYAVPGTYSMLVKSSLGCDSVAILKLMIYPDDANCNSYFPNSFTPNGDSRNDRFRIINTRNISAYLLTIYNRVGQKVFETKDAFTGWDGTYNGNALATGTFIWLCRYQQTGQSEVVQKGFVLLIR